MSSRKVMQAPTARRGIRPQAIRGFWEMIFGGHWRGG